MRPQLSTGEHLADLKRGPLRSTYNEINGDSDPREREVNRTFAAILFGSIAFVVWAYFTIFKLLVMLVWIVLKAVFHLRPRVPRSKTLHYRIERMLGISSKVAANHEARRREREAAMRSVWR